jgi:antitoxin component YwqK of YwqJK toxin-antitoxin module
MQTKLFILTYYILSFLLLGCTQTEISEIEKVLLDKTAIAKITNPENSDSTYVEFPKTKSLWSIEHYIIKPNKENIIYKDSTGIILAYFKRIDGKNYSGGEFYNNGQIMGKLSYSEPGIIDGEVKYYFENGRIRSKGLWKNNEQVGIWKNYNKNGQLISTETYDENGKMINHEKIKTNR